MTETYTSAELIRNMSYQNTISYTVIIKYKYIEIQLFSRKKNTCEVAWLFSRNQITHLKVLFNGVTAMTSIGYSQKYRFY